jgi:hypothetical protein
MSENPEKKIIVDEDWKSQVEREREAALKTSAGGSPSGEPAAGGQSAGGPPPEAELPPANLSYLARSLYFQATIFLGLMPNPSDDKVEKNLVAAKHAIDMLAVLQEKTEGNRTSQESDEIEAMLYQLRMAYVELAK